MAIQAQMYPDNLGLPLGGGYQSQDWLFMDNNINNNFFTGCGLNNELGFSLQQQKQQQQLLFQQQQQQKQFLFQQIMQQQQQQQRKNQSLSSTTTTSTTTTGDHISMNLSQSFAAQLEKQRQEVDRYINLQNERLKLALQEQRKQQLSAILSKLEAKAMVLLRQKDEEIAKATKRAMELEDFVRKMEVENQAWQRLAAENEAMVVSLNNTLEQLKEQQACCLNSTNNGVDDAESCCDMNDCYNNNRGNEEEVEGTGENRGEEREKTGEMKKMMMMGMCRGCNSRNACVLLLPCRHLCSCKACEPFLDACPVCKSVKKASIEVLIS